MEPGDWTHTQPDADIPDPRYTLEQMIRHCQIAAARKNVPILNVSITQDGRVSPVTLDLFRNLHRAVQRDRKG